MRQKISLVTLVQLLGCGILCVSLLIPSAFAGNPAAKNGITVSHNVKFLEAGRVERMDLYMPESKMPRKGAVVWIHGGGWIGGKKDANREINVCTNLAKRGYVCASIEYKLGKGAWPQNLFDCKNAVRFMRVHAREFGIDPGKIAVAGGSAGGHLALMVAFTIGLPKLEPSTPYPGISSKVNCVIDFYGVTNLQTREVTAKNGKPIGGWKLGGAGRVFGATHQDDQILQKVSPVNYVTSKSPPVFIIHGQADTTVDYFQATELDKVLTKHHVEHELLLLPHVGHTFDLQTWARKPLPQDLRSVVFDFLDHWMEGNPD